MRYGVIRWCLASVLMLAVAAPSGAVAAPGGLAGAAPVAASLGSSAQPSCAIAAPTPDATVQGTRVVLSAAADNAESVYYQLDGGYLGAALPTYYGWLFTYDNGASWGWDSTTAANGAHELTCVAVSASGEQATSAPIAINVDNPAGCYIAAPGGTQPVSGTIAISAGTTVPDIVKVELYLHSADIAVIPLGEAIRTGYGWLYTPDGGQTFGWDSTQYPLGVYSLSCAATDNQGVRHTSTELVFTLDNATRHDWPSYCSDHVATTPEDYQAAFDYRSGGWAGADGAHPITLPDGRVMWLFGDTLAGEINEDYELQPGWRMPSNSVVIQSGTCFTPVMGGTPEAPTHFLTDAGGKRFWPATGYVDTAVSPPVLRLTATWVVSGECGWFRLAGVRVFTLSLPSLEVIADAPAPYDQALSNVPSFGSGLMFDGQYAYLYGSAAGFQCERDDPGPYPAGRYVARSAPGALASGPWQYWDGTGWSADIADAVATIYGDGDVDVWPQGVMPYGDTYLHTTRRPTYGAFEPVIHAWTADNPAGPWEQLADAAGEPVDITGGLAPFPDPRWYYGGMVYTEGVPGASPAEPLLVFSTNSIDCDPEEDEGCENPDSVLRYGPHFLRPAGLPAP